jgi:hypothetical protein
MILIYQLLPLACLIIVGIWTLFGKDMLLGPLGDWMEGKFPDFWLKPVFTCPPCMSSLHGTWIWFLFGGGLWLWPVFCLALCGLNKIVSHKILT